MKAVTWQGRRRIEVATVPDPQIVHPTDAVIEVTTTGPCGSDLHRYEVRGPALSASALLSVVGPAHAAPAKDPLPADIPDFQAALDAVKSTSVRDAVCGFLRPTVPSGSAGEPVQTIPATAEPCRDLPAFTIKDALARNEIAPGFVVGTAKPLPTEAVKLTQLVSSLSTTVNGRNATVMLVPTRGGGWLPGSHPRRRQRRRVCRQGRPGHAGVHRAADPRLVPAQAHHRRAPLRPGRAGTRWPGIGVAQRLRETGQGALRRRAARLGVRRQRLLQRIQPPGQAADGSSSALLFADGSSAALASPVERSSSADAGAQAPAEPDSYAPLRPGSRPGRSGPAGVGRDRRPGPRTVLSHGREGAALLSGQRASTSARSIWGCASGCRGRRGWRRTVWRSRRTTRSCRAATRGSSRARPPRP